MKCCTPSGNYDLRVITTVKNVCTTFPPELKLYCKKFNSISDIILKEYTKQLTPNGDVCFCHNFDHHCDHHYLFIYLVCVTPFVEYTRGNVDRKRTKRAICHYTTSRCHVRFILFYYLYQRLFGISHNMLMRNIPLAH